MNEYIQHFGGNTCGKETTCKTPELVGDNIKMDLQEVDWGPL